MRHLRALIAILLLVALPKPGLSGIAPLSGLLAFAVPSNRTAVTGLEAKIEAIIHQPQVSSAYWGIEVLDLDSGKIVYSLNPDHLFLPASNAKLLTTAAALAAAGTDYRFHTTVETAGKLDAEGRLVGDLVIVGRGDANISGRVLPYQLKTERISPPTQVLEELVGQLVQKGIKVVDGDLVGDDTFYSAQRYAEGWAYDDLQWLDGAPVSALSFNDNVLFLKIHPGEQVGESALVTVDPQCDYYELENRIETSAAGVGRKIGIHHEPGSSKVVLWGTIPLNDSGTIEAIAVDDPALFTAEIFRGVLESHGVAITGKTRARHGDPNEFFDQPLQPSVEPVARNSSRCCLNAAGVVSPTSVLAEHVSVPLLEDIRVTNKTSQNLHAELLLRLVGKLNGGIGSFEDGSAAVRQFLLRAGVKSNEFYMLDGSGLSRRDLVTPAAMVQLLAYAARQPWGPAFAQTLPVAGSDGSLAERFLNTPAGGLVQAKTGTLSHVNALSGYGETKAGKRFVFSIFCNNHNLASPKVTTAIDAIVVLLVKDI